MEITVNMTSEELLDFQRWKNLEEKTPLVKIVHFDRYGTKTESDRIIFENEEFSEELLKIKALSKTMDCNFWRSYENAINSGIEKSKKIKELEEELRRIKEKPRKKPFWDERD